MKCTPAMQWQRTLTTCPDHSAVGQPLFDAVRGENGRKNVILGIIEAQTDLETRTDRTTWLFSNDRISGTDERVLDVIINNVNVAAINQIQAAADVQFGAGTIRVS